LQRLSGGELPVKEGIASNILADRLKRLVDAGILTRGTAARGQRARFSLTEAGIQTLPIIYALGNWGLDWTSGSAELRSRQELMRDEGPAFIEELMDELRLRHLSAPPEAHKGAGPLERLNAAYVAAVLGSSESSPTATR